MALDHGTVRVDIERLDSLLNLIGELVINRAALIELGKKSRSTYGFKEQVLELVETTEQVGRISEEIQSKIIKSRMIPISNVFNRFGRLVENLSQEDKKVELVIKGETTEIDKKIIDDLAEPLVHLVRNAIDHGVEKIEDRKRAGKSEAGTVTLNAYHEGNHLAIEVNDDGGGIDLDKVKKAAVKKGIIDQVGADALEEKAIIELLFHPRFSTAEKVTDMSGRGVGTDAARRKIESLGGSVTLTSVRGGGSLAMIKLPLTMAIIQALSVEVGGEVYAIPLEHVSETIRTSDVEISTVENYEVIELRGAALSLMRLSDALQTPDYFAPEKLYVVVVKSGDDQIGLVIDRVLDRQEVVIKNLGRRLSNIRGISGASISGDGNVVMILDVQALIEIAKEEGIAG